MHKIAAVFDSHFGHRLLSVADDRHVWIVESELNDPWIRKIWQRDRSEPPGAGVTSFVALPNEAPENQMIRMLDTMADHHEYGMQTPPWFELDIYGVTLGPEVKSALANLGFARIEPITDGFRAYRMED